MTVGLVGPHKSQVRRPKVMLIDLDDTLYRAHTIPTIVRERIQGASAWMTGQYAFAWRGASVDGAAVKSLLSLSSTCYVAEFMVKKLGVSEDKVTALTLELYQKYGTTLAGLVVGAAQLGCNLECIPG